MPIWSLWKIVPGAITRAGGISLVFTLVVLGLFASYLGSATNNLTTTSRESTASINTTTSSTTSSVGTVPHLGGSVTPGDCGIYSGGLNTWVVTNDIVQQILVFMMRPNSSARLCVNYSVGSQYLSHLSANTTIDFISGILVVNATADDNSGFSYSDSTAKNITISSKPSSVTFSNYSVANEFNVVYTIDAGQNSKGFYTISTFMQCPPFLALAVGYEPQELNASDFNGFFLVSGCTLHLPLASWKLTGFLEMTAVYLSGV